MSGAAPLRLEVDEGVATLTLNRPEVLNALNLALKAALASALVEVRERDDVRAVLLTGSGRGFCSGGDVKEMDAGRAPAQTRARLLALHRGLVEPLAALDKPVVCALNGIAAGAGVSLALACDFAIAADSASLSFAFIKRAVVPDAGAAYRLVRLIGPARAKDLIFSGRTLSADAALTLGLVQRVVPAQVLAAESMAWARELARGPTVTLGLAKRLLDLAVHTGPREMTEHEIGMAIQAIGTVDHAEALQAFAEKRQPKFIGR